MIVVMLMKMIEGGCGTPTYAIKESPKTYNPSEDQEKKCCSTVTVYTSGAQMDQVCIFQPINPKVIPQVPTPYMESFKVHSKHLGQNEGNRSKMCCSLFCAGSPGMTPAG